MTRKVAKQVATTGIDIDKNSLHLLGLEGCFGSHIAVNGRGEPRLLLGVKRKKTSPKPTSSITLSKSVAVLANENAQPGLVG
jgi:hypothetical protein